MLDENLPTFRFKQSTEDPLNQIVYLTRNGSEPAPEYVFKRAHPSINPAASKKYAVGLADPYAPDVIYAEVIVSPVWQQPSLSAAEIRAQQMQTGAARAPVVPSIPDNFSIQLYDPDQTVNVKYIPSSLTKTESWEFEMLSQSFKMPSASQLDRQNGDEPTVDFRPRNMFKWKKDGRLTKDMTCYNVGKSLGKHKSKDPDITVALFKQGRETALTVYEPNLQRVDMEDRKGLDIVLVIGAEVIRDLYLAPEKRPDLFNVGASGVPVVTANGRRKNSRPSPPPAGFGRTPTAGPTIAMSGALGVASPVMSTANVAPSYLGKPSAADIDAETERLRQQVEREERDQMERETRERERRDREEQKRIERMLKEEEKEMRRREADVAAETERLKKLYGTQGQEFASGRPPVQQHNSSPPLPQRQQFQGYPPQHQPPPQQGGWSFAPPPTRPLSAGPGNPYGQPPGMAGPQQQSQAGPSRPGRKPSQGPYLSGSSPTAAVSGFFQSMQNLVDPKKLTKKKSMQW